MNESFVPVSRLTATLLYAGLATMFLGCFGVQAFFLPLVAAEASHEAPEFAYLRVPMLIVSILTIACIEVVIAATAVLLTKTRRREIFQTDALRWTNVMIFASFTAAALCAGTFFYLQLVAHAMAPIVAMALIATFVAGTCVALVMIVLRSLLTNAVFLTRELDGVI